MSTPPPGYTPTESLLSGGTAPIIGVMGGGAMKTRRRKTKKQSRKGSRKRMRGGAATEDTNPFILREAAEVGPKVYSPVTVADVAVPGTSEPALDEVAKTEIPFVRNAYIDRQNDTWKRYVQRGSSATPQKAIQITVDKCASYLTLQSDEGQGGFDRLCIIRKQTASNITVFPAVKGDIDSYTK